MNEVIKRLREREQLAKAKAKMLKGPRRMKEEGKAEAFAEAVVLVIVESEEDDEL